MSVNLLSIPDALTSYSQQDVGAMRFPSIPPQERAFHLFHHLGLSNKLIRYVMSNKENDILYFNGRAMTVAEYDASPAQDPFATESVNPKEAETKFNIAIYPFKKKLRENFDEGWEMLMEQDRHTMRTYLSFEENFSEPVRVVQWCPFYISGSRILIQDD
jgi:hypothetical protein